MKSKKAFGERLSKLRLKKAISARLMSEYIGKSEGYINNIENGNNFPSMEAFMDICDCLNISPKDFFDCTSENPEKLKCLLEDLQLLSDEQAVHVSAIIKDIVKPAK